MYTPPHFKIDDHKRISAFIREHSFGLLLTTDGQVIHDTHTPFLLSGKNDILLGHIARANPQWKSWRNDTKAKVIFTGPHAYISPSNYTSEFNVPTWNYTAVSISGTVSIIEEENAKLEFLDQLTAQYESKSDPWTLDQNDERYLKLLSAIVVFQISMDDIETSFKLNQNKTNEDQESVITALQQSGCPYDAEIASLMLEKRNHDHS